MGSKSALRRHHSSRMRTDRHSCLHSEGRRVSGKIPYPLGVEATAAVSTHPTGMLTIPYPRVYPTPRFTLSPGLPYPPWVHPTPQKEPGIRDTLPPGKDMEPVNLEPDIPAPAWTDRHL